MLKILGPTFWAQAPLWAWAPGQILPLPYPLNTNDNGIEDDVTFSVSLLSNRNKTSSQFHISMFSKYIINTENTLMDIIVLLIGKNNRHNPLH